MLPSSRALLPLFLISFAAVGVEIALLRFFAVASWSEYGYWVISITMTGFAVSGVVMVLGREAFLRHAGWLLPALPLAMLVAGAGGWIAVTRVPFNPLELQNPATQAGQLLNILLYYAALFPFYFLAGLAVSLNFVVHANAVGRVYAWDLLGAGAGAVAALGLMWLLDPFDLIPALLPALALAALISPGMRPVLPAVTLAAAMGAVLWGATPVVSEYKPISAPLNVPDSRVVAELRTPRGLYRLLDNFTERADTDITNNTETLDLPAPPASFGLYRDGVRIASLPKAAPDGAYARGALDAAPYALLDHPRVLLLGASGGFRVAEARALGAREIVVVEPEPLLRRALATGFSEVAPMPRDPAVELSPLHALSALRHGPYDLIDVSGDFLGAAEPNRAAISADALAAALAALSPDGLVSVPMSIRELPAYAVRLIATGMEALRRVGVAEPERHIAIYRSAWTVRMLLSRAPFDDARLDALAAFCEERSFDLSYAPGRPRPESVWNDLPPVSLDRTTMERSAEAQDAVADEAAALIAGAPLADSFDRSPLTWDRPALSPVIRLAALPVALARIELLPQAEIGLLVNVAVLAQAALLAVLVILLPLARRGGMGARPGMVVRAIAYFPALGLGFLLIEIHLIEHAALLLADRTSGFAIVLTAMLVFSALGSLLSARYAAAPRRAMAVAAVVIVGWSVLVLLGGRWAVLSALDWPFLVRAGLVVLAAAPVSVALGLPFPLGLDRFQAASPALLPWAWALNGAFSMVATPLANLLGIGFGLPALLAAASLCYITAAIVLPRSPG